MIKNCPMRHENGNCIPAGGFCTANKNICEALHNAYRMGKAQLSQEGTTSDTISRTEVVEHLRRMLEATVTNTDYDEGYIDGIEFGISTVSTMPPAQSQSTAGQLNDSAQSTNLIDRQAAIDALNHMCSEDENEITVSRANVNSMLKSLPSVQPEPHEGHWIDKGDDGDWAWQIDGRGNTWHVWGCSECGKSVFAKSSYCPHCGAKMKGVRHEGD